MRWPPGPCGQGRLSEWRSPIDLRVRQAGRAGHGRRLMRRHLPRGPEEVHAAGRGPPVRSVGTRGSVRNGGRRRERRCDPGLGSRPSLGLLRSTVARNHGSFDAEPPGPSIGRRVRGSSASPPDLPESKGGDSRGRVVRTSHERRPGRHGMRSRGRFRSIRTRARQGGLGGDLVRSWRPGVSNRRAETTLRPSRDPKTDRRCVLALPREESDLARSAHRRSFDHSAPRRANPSSPCVRGRCAHLLP